jgi:argininosuccinate lyase
MPFREAYREAAEPARWAARDPRASLEARVSPGAPGDLRLDALATRLDLLDGALDAAP